MEKKKTLKIDLDELCSAMEDSSYKHEYYLDLETGEILFLSEYTDDEETGKLKERLRKSPTATSEYRKPNPMRGTKKCRISLPR